MSTALLEPPVRLFGESEPSAARGGGRLTLEERLRAMWQHGERRGGRRLSAVRVANGASRRCRRVRLLRQSPELSPMGADSSESLTPA